MKPVVPHAPRHSHRSELTLDKYFEEELPATPPPTPPVVIPPKEIFRVHSTKTLSGFRDIRREFKIKRLLDEFVTETGRILEYFSATDDKYNADVVHWVCELAEHYFVQYKKMGTTK
jgi:ribosomal protein S18